MVDSMHVETVYTYYHPVAGMVDPRRLIALWEDSWRSHGWDTKILSEGDAKDHPAFDIYLAQIRKFPSSNPSGYERACYMRHLAMAYVLDPGDPPAILTDYDVINQGFMPDHRVGTTPGTVTLLEPTRVPCAILGDYFAFEELVDCIFNYVPSPGEKHVSDMTIIRKTDLPRTNHCIEYLCSGRQVENDLGDGWKQAPLVHFSNYSFSKLGWGGDKADLIRRALNELKR